MNSKKLRKKKQILIKHFGLNCALCSFPIASPQEATLDHIIPTSKGGAVYSVSNLQLAHSACNHIKGDKIQPFTECVKEKSSYLKRNIIPSNTGWLDEG